MSNEDNNLQSKITVGIDIESTGIEGQIEQIKNLINTAFASPQGPDGFTPNVTNDQPLTPEQQSLIQDMVNQEVTAQIVTINTFKENLLPAPNVTLTGDDVHKLDLSAVQNVAMDLHFHLPEGTGGPPLDDNMVHYGGKVPDLETDTIHNVLDWTAGVFGSGSGGMANYSAQDDIHFQTIKNRILHDPLVNEDTTYGDIAGLTGAGGDIRRLYQLGQEQSSKITTRVGGGLGNQLRGIYERKYVQGPFSGGEGIVHGAIKESGALLTAQHFSDKIFEPERKFGRDFADTNPMIPERASMDWLIRSKQFDPMESALKGGEGKTYTNRLQFRDQLANQFHRNIAGLLEYSLHPEKLYGEEAEGSIIVPQEGQFSYSFFAPMSEAGMLSEIGKFESLIEPMTKSWFSKFEEQAEGIIPQEEIERTGEFMGDWRNWIKAVDIRNVINDDDLEYAIGQGGDYRSRVKLLAEMIQNRVNAPEEDAITYAEDVLGKTTFEDVTDLQFTEGKDPYGAYNPAGTDYTIDPNEPVKDRVLRLYEEEQNKSKAGAFRKVYNALGFGGKGDDQDEFDVKGGGFSSQIDRLLRLSTGGDSDEYGRLSKIVQRQTNVSGRNKDESTAMRNLEKVRKQFKIFGGKDLHGINYMEQIKKRMEDDKYSRVGGVGGTEGGNAFDMLKLAFDPKTTKKQKSRFLKSFSERILAYAEGARKDIEGTILGREFPDEEVYKSDMKTGKYSLPKNDPAPDISKPNGPDEEDEEDEGIELSSINVPAPDLSTPTSTKSGNLNKILKNVKLSDPDDPDDPDDPSNLSSEDDSYDPDDEDEDDFYPRGYPKGGYPKGGFPDKPTGKHKDLINKLKELKLSISDPDGLLEVEGIGEQIFEPDSFGEDDSIPRGFVDPSSEISFVNKLFSKRPSKFQKLHEGVQEPTTGYIKYMNKIKRADDEYDPIVDEAEMDARDEFVAYEGESELVEEGNLIFDWGEWRIDEAQDRLDEAEDEAQDRLEEWKKIMPKDWVYASVEDGGKKLRAPPTSGQGMTALEPFLFMGGRQILSAADKMEYIMKLGHEYKDFSPNENLRGGSDIWGNLVGRALDSEDYGGYDKMGRKIEELTAPPSEGYVPYDMTVGDDRYEAQWKYNLTFGKKGGARKGGAAEAIGKKITEAETITGQVWQDYEEGFDFKNFKGKGMNQKELKSLADLPLGKLLSAIKQMKEDPEQFSEAIKELTGKDVEGDLDVINVRDDVLIRAYIDKNVKGKVSDEFGKFSSLTRQFDAFSASMEDLDTFYLRVVPASSYAMKFSTMSG